MENKEKIRVLVINTLTKLDKIDWKEVKTKVPIEVQLEKLEDFDKYFEQGNIEKALVYALPIVKKTIENNNFDIIIVHSKGISLITYLIYNNIWNGHIILSSPIPNKANHLGTNTSQIDEAEDQWEEEWRPIIKILEGFSYNIAIGIGNSIDEELVIEEYLKPACEKNNWLLRKFEGTHRWIYEEKNWGNIGLLIDFVCFYKKKI